MRKLVWWERFQGETWIAACRDLEKGVIDASQCGIYALPGADSNRARLIGDVRQVRYMRSAGGALWIVGADALYGMQQGLPATIARMDAVGTPSRIRGFDDEVWIESDTGTWRWSSRKPGLVRFKQPTAMTMTFEVGGNKWASGYEGLYRWRSGETPKLIGPGMAWVSEVIFWEGCYWIGGDNGLYKLCGAETADLKKISGIKSVRSMVLAGWNVGAGEKFNSTSPPNTLWASTDIGLIRLFPRDLDKPVVVDPAAQDAVLTLAGDYLWIHSPGRIASWKLDASRAVELLPIKPQRIEKMCTDMADLWIFATGGLTRELIRVPKVRTPNAYLDFEQLRNAQPKGDDGTLSYHDTRYWHCQSIP